MEQTKQIEYDVVDHGIMNSNYFLGQGTAFTDYDYVVTGAGDTFNEALSDALGLMAQEPEIDDLHDQLDEIEKEERVSDDENLSVSACHEAWIDVSNEVTPDDYIDTCDHQEGDFPDFCEECHNNKVDELLESIDYCDYGLSYFVSILYRID